MTDGAPPQPRSPAAGGEVDPHLLELLACPLTKTPLIYDRAKGELVSRQARLAFPIRDGVPVMVVDLARALDDDEAARL